MLLHKLQNIKNDISRLPEHQAHIAIELDVRLQLVAQMRAGLSDKMFADYYSVAGFYFARGTADHDTIKAIELAIELAFYPAQTNP